MGCGERVRLQCMCVQEVVGWEQGRWLIGAVRLEGGERMVAGNGCRQRFWLS